MLSLRTSDAIPASSSRPFNSSTSGAFCDEKSSFILLTLLTKSITDPAPMAVDLEQRRYRWVRCIRWLAVYVSIPTEQQILRLPSPSCVSTRVHETDESNM